MKVLARVSPASRSRLAQKFSIVTRAVVCTYLPKPFPPYPVQISPKILPWEMRVAGGWRCQRSRIISSWIIFARGITDSSVKIQTEKRKKQKTQSHTKKSTQRRLLKTSRGHSNISAVKGSRLHHNDSQRRQIDLARHGFQSGPIFWW